MELIIHEPAKAVSRLFRILKKMLLISGIRGYRLP